MCPRRSAFTLIELLVVVLILGMLASVAVPALNRLHENSIDRTVAWVSSVDSQMRLQARTENRSIDLIAYLADPQGISARKHNDVTVTWLQEDNTPLEHLFIDTRGRSINATVALTNGKETRRYRLLGIADEWIAE